MQYIDLRSDTVTQPTKQMRESILTANYGDWAYGQDQTVIALQKKVTELLGKQDSTFVPSGVFGNQALILSVGHPGEQLLIGQKSHIVRYENGSVGMISRMFAKTLPADENGFLLPQILKKFIRKINDSQSPRSSILCLQNPTCEGRVYPLQMFRQLIKIGKQNKLHVHLDGARLFHAVAYYNIDVKQLVKQVDSVMFCLSKGLSSPIGSMVVGTKNVIAKVRDNRKRLGGNLRKPGVIAQSCFISLDNREYFVNKAHESAKKLAQQLANLPYIKIVQKIDINMVFFKFITLENSVPLDFKKFNSFLFENKIKCSLKQGQTNRFVAHHYIGQEQIKKVIGKIKQFYDQTQKKQSRMNEILNQFN